ncbi:MAG: CHASE2 domain-containing protein [Chthoniobacterales bacterium]
MFRLSPWPLLVILLLGILFLREPTLQRSEEVFLRWLLNNSVPRGPSVPLTVVEIAHDPLLDKIDEPSDRASTVQSAAASAVSPLEYALFLQSALAFQPTVIAFENVLKWRDRDKDQEQVFIDQAMRVPRLLLAAELTPTPDPDAPGAETAIFSNVTGRRTDLEEFSGAAHQPNDELRLISTVGFVNLPDENVDLARVPLLFLYKGEVVPSFALQAVLLWLRVTPAEVRIELGKQILLPQNRAIPIRTDGSLVIHPNAAGKAHRLALNELLVAAQQRDRGTKPTTLETMRDHIVLVRTPANALSPPDVFAATIATIQGNAYLRRVHWIFDCIVLLVIGAFSPFFRRFSTPDLFLGAIAVTATYCLIALGVISRWLIWLPGFLPLGALWTAVVVSLFLRPRKRLRPASALAVTRPVI